MTNLKNNLEAKHGTYDIREILLAFNSCLEEKGRERKGEKKKGKKKRKKKRLAHKWFQ
jgi:hypothetical protein